MLHSFFFVIFSIVCQQHATYARSSVVPQDLRIEYIDNPQGLDVSSPRFSWILDANASKHFGVAQTAYRILVASSLDLLHEGKADMWDSKWIASSKMSHIHYEGKKLKSDRTYYWKVALKDNNQHISNWSAVKKWTTGLLSEGMWKGEWIGGDEIFDPKLNDCNIWDPWLRKIFKLDFKPEQANIYVASIGFHELYVNGQRVGDEVMAPVVTDHTKRARYVVYDIADFLNKGDNVIAIWLGTSWSIFAGYDVDKSRARTPMVSAQVDFYRKKPDDTHLPDKSIITDSSWKVKNSPNKLLGIWDFGKMGGELWDDRKSEKDWNLVHYNDNAWNSAKVYYLPLKLSAQNMRGNILADEISPAAIESLRDGSYLVDMGVNFAGWTQIYIKGSAGDTIHFYYSEREKEMMTFNMYSKYILGESGEGVFKNRFNYSSGRWITIKGLKYKPKLHDIKGWLVQSDFDEVGNFESSDSLHNWIYEKVKWNFRNLSLGGFIVDCPQRERMGYGGDAHATTESGMYNFRLGAFYTKWMQDWRDVQGTEPMVGNMNDPAYARIEVTSGRIFNNGILPHTAPTYWGGGGPSWGGIVVTLPWFMYQQYGDIKVLNDNYQLIKNWIAFLDSNVENDLLKRFGGKWDFLGDWLWPNATAEGMNNDKEETVCLNNTYRVYNLRTASKIAAIIGDTTQSRIWKNKADKSALAINKKYYNKSTYTYSDGSMANLASALLSEVVPVSERGRVMASLEKEILNNRNGHIHAGITGGALLFKFLRDENRNDLIYAMTSKTTYPSWGYMKDNGATTLWEMWEKDLPGHSLLHSSYLFPGAWYIEGVLGIKHHLPGFTEFVIDPPQSHETSLKWAKGSFNSPVGLISSSWNREGAGLRLSVIIPANTTCLLKLNEEDATIIKERKGILTRVGKENNKIIFKLKSGKYDF